jgi:transcriptional regulator with XRE-family HTH domain
MIPCRWRIEMPQKNLLAEAPPYAVENAIRTLGINLKTARLRRNMTVAQAAARIGVGVRAVSAAESGKPTTAVVVYYSLLWLYGLLPPAEDLADPDFDTEGKRLASLRDPKRAGARKGMDNDF